MKCTVDSNSNSAISKIKFESLMFYFDIQVVQKGRISRKDTVQLRPKSAPMKKCPDKILDFEYVIMFLSTFKN